MRKLPPFNCLLAVLLLASLLYFGYQVATAYLRYQSVKQLQQAIYNGAAAPPAGEVDADLAKVEAALASHGGNELKAFKNEMLLFKAWFYPDESLTPLRTVLPLGLELYREGDPWQEIAGWHVAWALSYAGLPVRLERWSGEVLVRAPQLRPRLTCLLIEGKVAQDDLAGARALIDDELKQRGSMLEGRITALSGLVLIGDMEQAQALAPTQADIVNLDSNQLLALAQLALETQHFAQAREYINKVKVELPDDADLALLEAAAVAGLGGLDDKQLPGLLKLAAASTRQPRTLNGSRARVCAELGRITGKGEWLVELARLAAAQPQDYDIAAAQAYLAVTEIETPPGDGEPPATLSDPAGSVQAAEHALELAQAPAQHQEALLLLAQARAHQALALAQTSSLGVEETLSAAARDLRQALGDPVEVDTVATERVPDYGAFLLDEDVQAMRSQSPEFDRLVNEAVIDFLNRRVALFNSIPQLKPLDDLPYRTSANAVVGPTAPARLSRPEPQLVYPEPKVVHKL
jgi:hypothetical protein